MSNIDKMEAAGELAISALQIVKANGSLSDAQLAVIEEALNAMFDAMPVWHSHPKSSTPDSEEVERMAKAVSELIANEFAGNLHSTTLGLMGAEILKLRAENAELREALKEIALRTIPYKDDHEGWPLVSGVHSVAARALLSRTKDDEQAFDEKIERDAKAGKLDKLEEKALENYKAGRTDEL